MRRIGEGGGDEHEDINVHLVARADIPNFLEQKRAEGFADRRQVADLPRLLNRERPSRVHDLWPASSTCPTFISAPMTSAWSKRSSASVDELKPDLVVISGDFTQRARTEQFREACEFLERLRERGHEVLGVPGNHDVPLYDVLRRFLSPLARYRRFIDDSLCPFVELPGVAVLGINTARSLTFKDGRISRDQVDFIRETFARTDRRSRRACSSPIIRCSRSRSASEVERAIGRQELALDAIEEAGVDLLLAGHAHHASAHDARAIW